MSPAHSRFTAWSVVCGLTAIHLVGCITIPPLPDEFRQGKVPITIAPIDVPEVDLHDSLALWPTAGAVALAYEAVGPLREKRFLLSLERGGGFSLGESLREAFEAQLSRRNFEFVEPTEAQVILRVEVFGWGFDLEDRPRLDGGVFLVSTDSTELWASGIHIDGGEAVFSEYSYAEFIEDPEELVKDFERASRAFVRQALDRMYPRD